MRPKKKRSILVLLAFVAGNVLFMLEVIPIGILGAPIHDFAIYWEKIIGII